MIKVLIIDDQKILTEGLKMILSADDQLSVIGTGENGQEALNLCRVQIPDVVLMDIQMPLMNGVEATAKIKRLYPSTKVIVLTTFDDDTYIFEAIKNGASGYLLKDTPPDQIAKAVKTVHGGGALIQPDLAQKVLDQFSHMAKEEQHSQPSSVDPVFSTLTSREKDISSLVGQGFNNAEIADRLFLSEGTIKNNLTKILDKLDLRDRTQLAILAVKHENELK
tara:strand:+ start:44 stop:709 length:666 start_codon:yes stop_codon:yes gene_type:complete